MNSLFSRRDLERLVELGKHRFLIELPTGTGKTDLVCLYLKRLIAAGRADRILFLVDREQLAKQALESLQDVLGGVALLVDDRRCPIPSYSKGLPPSSKPPDTQPLARSTPS